MSNVYRIQLDQITKIWIIHYFNTHTDLINICIKKSGLFIFNKIYNMSDCEEDVNSLGSDYDNDVES